MLLEETTTLRWKHAWVSYRIPPMALRLSMRVNLGRLSQVEVACILISSTINHDSEVNIL